jgi:LPS export ABC transporter protein LptC
MRRLFFLIQVLLLCACRNDLEQVKAITDNTLEPVQSSRNAVYIFSEKGEKQSRLEAKLLEQFDLGGDEDYMLASDGFQMIFFDSLEQEDAHITAKFGKFEEKKRRFTAWGTVVLVNELGEKLETEELIYLPDSARITSEKQVKITMEGGTVLHGKGLESNDNFTQYRILQPSGEILLDDNQNETDGKNQ